MWENVVNKELISRGINDVCQLNIKSLSDAFNVNIVYWNCSTRIVKDDELYYCIIDNRKHPVLQYEEFLHELAHIIYDNDLCVANDKRIYFYRECKVNHLVPLIAIPKFAIMHILGKTVEEISSEFGITRSLAMKRLKHIYCKGVDRYESSLIRSGINRWSN